MVNKRKAGKQVAKSKIKPHQKAESDSNALPTEGNFEFFLKNVLTRDFWTHHWEKKFVHLKSVQGNFLPSYLTCDRVIADLLEGEQASQLGPDGAPRVYSVNERYVDGDGPPAEDAAARGVGHDPHPSDKPGKELIPVTRPRRLP